MRLRIDFGTAGSRREVNWWQPLEDFPTAIYFDGQRWEWILYDEDVNKQYDKILTFGHMKVGDSRWFTCTDFTERFGFSSRSSCECGSAYSWAPQFHMFFCPMWRKV